MTRVELEVDVTAGAGLGEPAMMALTVQFDPSAARDQARIVCFAKPGAGFTRHYFTTDLPGRGSGAQSDWHAARGWIFVAVDHLGVGGSSIHDSARLTFATLTAAAAEAEQTVLSRLREATLHPDLPAVVDPVAIGIGQSMGGALTIAQQGRYHCYDGIASLGYSAVHTHPPTTPGKAAMVAEWRARDARGGDAPIVLNQAAYEAAAAPWEEFTAELRWHFFYDDDEELCGPALSYLATDGVDRPWLSSGFPGGVIEYVLTPGVVAGEAASVTTPVLVAVGERDDIPDLPGESRAYLSAPSVDLYTCPRAGHMHNFAETREIFWQRTATWAEWVRAWRAANPR